MEWKRNIIECIVRYPAGQAVSKKDVKAAVFQIALATEGIDRQKALPAFVDAVAGMKKRGVLINGGDHLIIPDHELAKASLNRYSGAKPMKGHCPEPGCSRNIRSFGYCRPCAERLHDAGLLTVDGRGTPIPTCSLEDCTTLRYKAGQCYWHWALGTGRKPTDRVSTTPPDHYDWVVVDRYWRGRHTGRELTTPERIEIVRLMIRSGHTFAELSRQMDQAESTLLKMSGKYEKRAREIGLEQPLRFCFLPYEEEEELMAA